MTVLGIDIGDMFLRHADTPELQAFIDGMACAAAAEINLLDPDAVLIGGGVANMAGFPQALLEEKIREHTRKPLPYADLHLIFTDDEPDKSVIGGAIYAHQPPRDRV